MLGVPEIGAGPWVDEIFDPLGYGIRHVIVVLMDALAYHRLIRWMQDGTAPVWGKLAEQGLFAPITSITPSTTSAALAALWTGRSAAEHGITGYEMWMREYGVVANTILQMPITFRSDPGGLERAGFEPENYLPFPTLGSHLLKNGVQSFALQNHSIAHSGLSRMLMKDVAMKAFSSAADLWVNLRRLLEEQAGIPSFVWVYWGDVDHFGHFYGPDDERTAAEFSIFSEAMRSLFLNRLSAAARKDTLLILTADHGLITTPFDRKFDLRFHPDLNRCLHLLPTGENRLAYLYVRPGQIDPVKEYLEHAWPNQFDVLDAEHAVRSGLLGIGEQHPRLLERVGDLMVIAKGSAYLWWAEKENRMIGRHGGLHPEEMLVPLLAARL